MRNPRRMPIDPQVGTKIEAEIRDLSERLGGFSLKAPKETQEKILTFCLELIAWNRRHGLLSHGDIQHIVTKHIAASLGVFLGVGPTPKSKWVDVGTGGGFPGLILKIWHPELELTLIEAAHKRCAFLRHSIQILDLKQVALHQSRAETLVARGDLVGEFDILLCRAVTDLVTTLREFSPLVRTGGRIVTFKGPSWSDEVRLGAAAGLGAGGMFELEECLCVPWTTAHLLIIRKH